MAAPISKIRPCTDLLPQGDGFTNRQRIERYIQKIDSVEDLKRIQAQCPDFRIDDAVGELSVLHRTVVISGYSELLPLLEHLLKEVPHLINKGNGKGQTPLFFAASFCEEESVRRLIQAGADVNLSAEDGRVPLDAVSKSIVHEGDFARRAESIVRALLEAGAEINRASGLPAEVYTKMEAIKKDIRQSRVGVVADRLPVEGVPEMCVDYFF